MSGPAEKRVRVPRWRRWLMRRGWAMCDDCFSVRPHRWAWRFGWMLGGQAGWYDLCVRCREERASNGGGS